MPTTGVMHPDEVAIRKHLRHLRQMQLAMQRLSINPKPGGGSFGWRIGALAWAINELSRKYCVSMRDVDAEIAAYQATRTEAGDPANAE